MLKEIGAEYVFDSSTETFYDDIKEAVEKLKPMGYFSACAGDMPGKILDFMPPKSTVYIYGGLNGVKVPYNIGGLIFR